MGPVYLDNNATTPVAPEAVEAMLPYLRGKFGNPSSAHYLGREAHTALDRARQQVAALMGCRDDRVVFVSCGSEANNTALYAWLAQAQEKRHIVISDVEHSSINAFATAQEQQGYRVTRVPVEPTGALQPDAVADALDDETACVAIMWANNETGVVHPIPEIAAICQDRGVKLHVDAVQAAGKLPMELDALPIDSAAISAHKFAGPKGAAVLYLRSGRRYRPLIYGGQQEHHRRGGTENVPGIAGMGVAAEIALRELTTEPARQGALRDAFEERLLSIVPDAVIHGTDTERLANTTSFHVANIEGEAMVRMLSEHGICVSTGAACDEGTGEPSHVMLALGLTKEEAHGSLRISLGRTTTQRDLAALADALPGIVDQLRHILPSAV